VTAIEDRAAELGAKLGPPLTQELPISLCTVRAYYNGALLQIPGAGVYCVAEATVAQLFVPPPTTPPLVAPNGDPWEHWDALTISAAANAPLEGVETTWPLIHHGLVERGQASRNSQAGSIGTCSIETAHTFLPVTEAFWMSEEWRYANLRYAPYWGRGDIQLTWESNYRKMSPVVSVNLVEHPEAALEPGNAAVIFAEYWKDHDIQSPADAEDWAEVRRRVQGADAGLDELERIVHELLYV